MSRGVVYTLHFWPKLAHAGHYTGSAREQRLARRLTDHALGRGARITQVQGQRGGHWVVGRVEPGGRDRERQLKNMHNAAKHCDVCQALNGRQSGRLTTEQALSRAGWNTASQYQKSLLLEIFGLQAPPDSLIPEKHPEPAVKPIIPAPRPEPVKSTPEIDALVDALIESWTTPKAEPAPETGMEAGQ
jgi:hypothetical protein